ncbi:hypothetical protein RclHR1_10450008 [Rhizophagus clarus]|uniref:Uncharacterized protein n=1 Tax=Rhizophagus clarus TaxID=94130 RepID=A0A2Z6Q2T3_9GLOM|nr:hypothetical protein RclHR1_10450008 [Rhizophagus clarus]
MGNWILQVAYEGDSEFQEKILTIIASTLQQLDNAKNSLQKKNSSSLANDTNYLLQENSLLLGKNKDLKVPSFFVVKSIFKLYHINLNNLNSKNCYSFGNELAKFLLKNCQYLRNNKVMLESSQSLNEYQNAIPVELYNVFRGMVEKLLLNRYQIANKTAKSRKKEYVHKELDQNKVQKISIMLKVYNNNNLLLPANIVILEAGGNPNNNDDIANAYDQYFIDLNINDDEIKYPKLRILLEFVSSVNLTHDGHFYAFDETLEIFGVKYIKKNVTGNIYNIKNLKKQIKAAQIERERMDLLFEEFLDDIVISKKDQAVDGRREAFWTLVNSLLTAFDLPNPTSLSLF